ncbi:hypothetical protein ACS0TY_018987 [Phlomoides rotata]
MKVITSYLLAVLGGNASPSAKDLKGILGSVGSREKISWSSSQLRREKLASVPSGGGVVQLLQLPLVLEVVVLHQLQLSQRKRRKLYRRRSRMMICALTKGLRNWKYIAQIATYSRLFFDLWMSFVVLERKRGDLAEGKRSRDRSPVRELRESEIVEHCNN